jgi:hypothetical protein
MNTFLVTLLVTSLVVNIMITFLGMRVKTNENLILFQSLPASFMYSILFFCIPLQRYLFPGEDIEGYGIGFVVMLPTVLFLVISMTILGIKGLKQWKVENDKFLFVTSLASSLVVVSMVFTHFLFPFLTLYIVGTKVVRKLKGRAKIIA